MTHKSFNTPSVTAAGITAAAYAVLTLVFAPLSYGGVQIRVSELLCILPFFLPPCTWGLFMGCLVANLFGGNVIDIIFGSLATLLSALITARLGAGGSSRMRKFMACLVNVLVNAVIVGLIITYAYNGINPLEHPAAFAINALQVAMGEAAVMFALGFPLMLYLPKKRFFINYVRKITGREL